jgi:hypothetical protein
MTNLNGPHFDDLREGKVGVYADGVRERFRVPDAVDYWDGEAPLTDAGSSSA